jgi:hypothetical protein
VVRTEGIWEEAVGLGWRVEVEVEREEREEIMGDIATDEGARDAAGEKSASSIATEPSSSSKLSGVSTPMESSDSESGSYRGTGACERERERSTSCWRFGLSFTSCLTPDLSLMRGSESVLV